MSWETDLTKFYERLKPKPIFNTPAEIETIFIDVVVPTLESIADQLKLHAKKVKIKKYKYKAYISFDDKSITRNSFGVCIDLKYQTISFPYSLNTISSRDSGIKLKKLEDINKELIITHFMDFFMSREETLKRFLLDKAEAEKTERSLQEEQH